MLTINECNELCNGLLGKRPKEKYHSYQGNVGKVADNIINRDFKVTAPLQKWTTDVSQFNFSWGKCYIDYFAAPAPSIRNLSTTII